MLAVFKRCEMRITTGPKALLALLVATSPVAGQVEIEGMRAFDRPFLELVGAIEAPRGYDTITGFAPFPPDLPITRMTIGEVMDWQTRIRAAGAEATAVGRFQFVRDTLDFLTRRYDVPHDTVLDRRTQDYLARVLMHRCDFYDPQAPVEEVGDCLAGTWAALPMLTGPKRGRSRYEGRANNHARTSPEVVSAVLAVRFAPDALSVAARGASDVGRTVADLISGPSHERVGLGAVITDANFSRYVFVDNSSPESRTSLNSGPTRD